MLKALEVLPHPKAAAQDCRLYFSGGNASVRSLVKGAERTLAAVFKRAKVNGGHPHRFRHTFGADMVRAGISLPALQCLMGHSRIHTTLLYVQLAPQDVWREYARAVENRTRWSTPPIP